MNVHICEVTEKSFRLPMFLRPVSLLLLALLILPGHAWSWGFDQHKVIARIAEARLTPKTRKEIENILGPNTSLSNVAVWADMVKDARPHTRPWHYINYPLELDEPDYDVMNTPEGNVLYAITTQIALLKNPRSDREIREDALKFLVHLVGDIHQPLHCGIAKDRGGNTIQVILMERLSNLHAIWDSEMFPVKEGQIDSLATGLVKDMTKEEIETIVSNQPYDWMVESHRLVRDTCYLRQERPPSGDSSKTPQHLSESYIQKNKVVAKKRIIAAGLRLAALLNEIFDGSAAPERVPPEGYDIHNIDR
jgi:nuclease S1